MYLLPFVLPLPSLPAVQAAGGGGGGAPAWVESLFDALVGCGGAQLRQRGEASCRALLLALAAPGLPMSETEGLSSALGPLLDDYHQALRAPLPPAGFSMLLPMLARALREEPPMSEAARETQDAALALLRLHCAPALALAQTEREAQAALLLAVMARGERQHAPCAAGLAALAQALEPGHLGPLLDAALHADAPTGRAAAMRALALVPTLKGLMHPAEGALAARLWLLRLDADVSCASCAEEVWRLYSRGVAWQNGELADGGERESGDGAEGGTELWAAALQSPGAELEAELLPLLGGGDPRVRRQAAAGLAAACELVAARLHPLLQQLFALYKDNNTFVQPSAPPPFGEPEPSDDGWRSRHGVGLTLAAVAPSLQAQAQLPVVFAFLKRALADDHDTVQAQFTEAGRLIIERQTEPEVMVKIVQPMLEAFLNEKATTEKDDRVRQGSVLYP